MKLKNVDGKAIIRGFAEHMSSQGLCKNDVIIAANELDARSASFEAIVEKFRWAPREGDWCGLQTGKDLLAQSTQTLRKRENSVDDSSGVSRVVPPAAYMHLTTPEQDIVASYPVKLSRVEDVVCIKVARPTDLKSRKVDGVVFI